MRVPMAVHKIILALALAACLPSLAFAKAPTWPDQAAALGKARDWAGLLAHSREWTKAEPENPVAWFSLGEAYARMGRHREAIDPFKEALRLKPDLADAWYSLGVAYGKLRRSQEEIEAYQKALRFKPDYVSALV